MQPSEPLNDIAGRLAARGWTCRLDEREDPVLRVRLPGDHPTPDREAEIVIRDGEPGAYFAYLRTPRRQIAPVGEVERAVRAIVHVHGGAMPPPPVVLPAVVALFAGCDGEPS